MFRVDTNHTEQLNTVMYHTEHQDSIDWSVITEAPTWLLGWCSGLFWKIFEACWRPGCAGSAAEWGASGTSPAGNCRRRLQDPPPAAAGSPSPAQIWQTSTSALKFVQQKTHPSGSRCCLLRSSAGPSCWTDPGPPENILSLAQESDKRGTCQRLAWRVCAGW